MTNEMFLTEEEKEKLSQRRSDYINNAIDKSDKTLQKIVKKRLLPVKEKKQKDYKHYLNELSKTEEKITAEIAKDESSPTKKRLKKYGTIQAIRDKAYTLHERCRSTAFECNRLIKGLNIISVIFSKRDRQTTKYYNAIFDDEQISQRMMRPIWYRIRNILLSLNSTFTDVLLTILGFLLFANNFFMLNDSFGDFNSLPLLGGQFVVSLVLSIIPGYFIINLLIVETNRITSAFTSAIYIINLTWIIIQLLFTRLSGIDMGMILKALVIVLIPLLIWLCIFLFAKFESSFVINKRHKKIYKRYYDFLYNECRKSEEYYYNLVEERIDTIKEDY